MTLDAPSDGTAADRQPDTLLTQYYEDLAVSALAAKNTRPDAPAEIAERVSELFQGDRSWRAAYEIEQCLIYLCDETTLDQQIQRRLVDLQKHGDTERYDRAQRLSNEVTGLRAKQELLLDITRTVQWAYGKRAEVRLYLQAIRTRSLVVFIGALVVFTGVLLASHTDWWFLTYERYSFNMRAFVIGIAAGFLGAAFSMLLRVKGDVTGIRGDLKIFSSFKYIVVRPAIGVCAALILFFLVQSGTLSGSLLPDLPITRETDQTLFVHYGNISKLIVWDLIAGFSEYFVPNLLTHRATQIRTAQDQDAQTTS